MYLPDQAREAISRHEENCLPNEACGLVALDGEGELRFVYPLTNANPSPTSYTVDPDEHFGALRHAEANGWVIGGAFHSHPETDPFPSFADVGAALEPEWVYLISSGEVLRGFRITRGVVTEVPLA